MGCVREISLVLILRLKKYLMRDTQAEIHYGIHKDFLNLFFALQNTVFLVWNTNMDCLWFCFQSRCDLKVLNRFHLAPEILASPLKWNFWGFSINNLCRQLWHLLREVFFISSAFSFQTSDLLYIWRLEQILSMNDSTSKCFVCTAEYDTLSIGKLLVWHV